MYEKVSIYVSLLSVCFSAGAGRTGTYIAIDNLIEEITETGHVDVFNAVIKMRRNREGIVQTAVRFKSVSCFD